MNRILPLLAVLTLTACAGARLERQKKEIEDLQTKAGALLSDLKNKTDEVDALKASKSELEARLIEVEGRSAAAEARVARLSKSNKDLSDAIGASQDELGGRLNAIVAEKDDLAKKLSDALKEKLAVERAKSSYQSARDKAVRELGRIKEERDALIVRLADLEGRGRQSEENRAAVMLKTREEMGSAADAVLEELQSGAARIEQNGESFALALSDGALFEEGSAKVHEKGAALLSRVGAALKALPGKAVRIEGHSDNSPFKKGLLGGYDGHWELSSARATAVARWLHEHVGLDPARLTASGVGEFRPVRPNDTPEGRAANRRIVLVVSPITP